MIVKLKDASEVVPWLTVCRYQPPAFLAGHLIAAQLHTNTQHRVRRQLSIAQLLNSHHAVSPSLMQIFI